MRPAKPLPASTGPFGHHFSFRVLADASTVSAADVAAAGFDVVNAGLESEVAFEVRYRSMNRRGDDETALYEVAAILREQLGLNEGWRIDWNQSTF